MEVINEDYNDFVSLSTKLVNVDGAVLRMQKPLQEVGEKLLAVKASLQKELDSLGQGLVLRQETAAAKALLELMQDTAHSMSKVMPDPENVPLAFCHCCAVPPEGVSTISKCDNQDMSHESEGFS